MTNFVEIIQTCEQASGAGSKKIIAQALASADLRALRLITSALDPYQVFGVKKYPAPIQHPVSDQSGAWTNFEELLSALSARRLTGDAARSAVTRALAQFSHPSAEMAARVLNKDLKAGFSADTVNKIFKGAVPSFDVMLASKCDTPEQFEQEVKFPCSAEVKLDGERTIALVQEDQVVYYSRSGKIAHHITGLFDSDLLKIRDYLGYDIAVDGERYASNFTETMNAKNESNNQAREALRLHLFFIMPLVDWQQQRTAITMAAARAQLEQLLARVPTQKLELPASREVKNYPDMLQWCDRAIDEYQYEGLILKDPAATYVWDRDPAWCKVKRMYDVDGEVYDFYSGRTGSRLQSTLGGICVRGWDERGREFEVNVGSGFDDAARDSIWANRELLRGRTVTVKFQEFSHSAATGKMSLRFPVFMHFRDDK